MRGYREGREGEKEMCRWGDVWMEDGIEGVDVFYRCEGIDSLRGS